MDGVLNIYDIQSPSSPILGNCHHRFQAHQAPITDMKLAYCKKNKSSHKTETIVIMCAEDRRVLGVNIENGGLLFSFSLSSSPLCLSVYKDWAAVGLADGRVQIISIKSSKMIMEFKAHMSEVRSLSLSSAACLITGGEDGTIRKWNLSGSPSVSPSLSRSPASIIDLYFQNTVQEIQAKRNDNGSLVAGFPSGSVQVIKTEGGSPVTAIQSDQYKIVSGHLNGDLRVHDMISGNALFHISGRPGRLKTLQFDDHRLISDGTLSVLVGHDFSVSFPQLSQDDIAVQMGRK